MEQNKLLRADLILELHELSLSLKQISNQDECDKIQQYLDKFEHHDEFYTETNLRSQEITWSKNIAKYLGYKDVCPNQSMPIYWLADFVHPVIRDWYKVYLNSAMLVFSKNKFTFLQSRFVINVPIKKQNGRYSLIKHVCMPFGIDENNKIVSFLNSYFVFGDYNGEPLKPQFFEGSEKLDWYYILMENNILPLIRVESKFRPTRVHFRLFDSIRQVKINNQDLNFTNIAEAFYKISGITISNHGIENVKKYLLTAKRRLEHFFQKDQENGDNEKKMFISYNSLAFFNYLDDSGILSILKRAF